MGFKYNDEDVTIMAKTIYAEARGEIEEGQVWVGHVIKNRAVKSGESVKTECLRPYQFECWNGETDIKTDDSKAYSTAKRITLEVLKSSSDPTGGCDHYNNPDKEGYPDWTKNVKKVKKVGNHQFYKA